MVLKILAIGDTADNIFAMKKFVKRSQIHLIIFPRKQDWLLTTSEDGIEVFDSLRISKQVKRIKQIKDNYELCLVVGWASARIAYLAGLNYVMYFVGNDITTPPFVKEPRISYLKNPIYKRNFFERYFYKKVFDSAIACVAPTIYFEHLKKYRKDSIRLDRIFVDTEIFNENVKAVDLPKKKFTFLSAQRFSLEKGFDIIWKALRLCKSDFEVLQVKWFIQNTNEEKEINKKLLEEIPPQVKFIPLIKRNELPQYYKYADAILGQMRTGIQGGIERDAAFCKKPVLCYTDPAIPTIIDGREIIPPFLPRSKDPKDLAELIDKVVESEEFREELARKEYEYVKELSHPTKVINDWENLFESLLKKYKSINRNTSLIKNTFENFIALLAEKLIYNRTMKEKNIRAWGKAEYERLTK